MKKFSTKLLAMILMLTVVLSMVSIGDINQVYAISVSSDVVKLIGAAQNLTNDKRVEIVNLIADESTGYELKASYTTNINSNAHTIYDIISAGSSEDITEASVKRGLEEFKAYYDSNSTNKAFAKYALSNLVEGLTNYSTSGYSFTSLKGNIEDYTITFDVFMNFMSHIKFLTAMKPLNSNAEKTNLSYNTQLDAYLNLAAVLGNVDEQRITAYKNRLVVLIDEVNDYSNTSERNEFIRYLIDEDMVTVASDDDDGPSGGGGGGSTTPTPTPAPTTSTITTAPTLNTSTGTATASITQSTITNALSNAATVTGTVKEATIEVPVVVGATSYAVQLPSTVLNTTTLNHTIEIVTQVASVQLPSNMLTGTAANNSVQLVVANAEPAQIPEALRAQIGSKPVVELSLLIGGKQTSWNNPDAPVTVSIAYTPTTEELKHPEHIVVWYIDGSGNVISVPSGRYDTVTGKVSFNVEHFSQYAVAYTFKTFGDLDKHEWARNQIEVMASKGIVTGISADKFNPAEKVTRGDYLKSLINALGLSAKFESSFDDVNAADAYYKEIAVAKKLGITTGIGNNKFAPKEAITRQDMMVLTAKALSIAKQIDLTDSTIELNNFGDQSKVAAYARNSTAAMIRTGLIVGDGKNVNPYANTSRAEAAVIMYRIYNK